jgi:sugar phosphate isomerase/epimerase
MKFGLSIEPFKGISVERLISAVRLINLDHIEVSSRIIPFADKVIPQLKQLTTTLHLPITDRDKFDFGTINANYEIIIAEITDFINSNHKEMNMNWTLSHPPEGENSTTEMLLERLAQLETPIVLENIKTMSDADFMDFYFQAKDCLGKQLAGHVLDVPHRYVHNWRTWLKIPKELEKEIVYIHISDCTKDEDSHKPLGLAELPYELFFDYLKRISFNGIINQELKPHPTEILDLLHSCLECVKPFSKRKYLYMKLLYSLATPFIKWQISSKLKAYKDVNFDKIAKDLSFDLA